ncbi:MAG: hypothetical protein KA257_07380 [Opitutaceae bacterium]|nr:hypothetical protein [Opitutaceae bacterium]MBP9912305.1 hypothetical protein [Opitutaceae bacterium]
MKITEQIMLRGRFVCRCFALLLAGALTGCNTVTERIAEKHEAYDELEPEAQQAIKQGRVGVGFTPDMVYMALGQPTKIVTSADGKETTWSFMNFNSPEGGFYNYPKHMVHFTGSDIVNKQVDPLNPGSSAFFADDPMAGDPSLNWQRVAGVNGLNDGQVGPTNDYKPAFQSEYAERRKTAEEQIKDDVRQDLLVKFVDGEVTECTTEIVY